MRRVIEKDRKRPVVDKEPSGCLQEIGVSRPYLDASLHSCVLKRLGFLEPDWGPQ